MCLKQGETMEFNESSTNLSASQHASPRVTPSPPIPSPSILTTTPGGLENDVMIDGNDAGVLRSRGRRRRPGRGRVRLPEDPNSSEEPQSHKCGESSDLLQPQSFTFIDTPPSPSPSKLGTARLSFKTLANKVSEKIISTKKQDHPLKRRATRRARAGSCRNRTGSRKVARCGSVRSNRSLPGNSEPGNIPGLNRTDPNGRPGSALPLSGDDAEAGRSSLSNRDDNQREEIQLATPKTTVKESVINLFHTGWTNFQSLIGVRKEEPSVIAQEIIKGNYKFIIPYLIE